MGLAEVVNRARVELGYWSRSEWSFEEVGRHWDSTEDYDEVNEATYSYFRRFTDGLRLSDLREGGTVLDLCSRTGKGSKFFYEQGKVGSVACADVSLKMGEACMRRLSEAGIHNWVWVPLDGYRLPFEGRYFDSVLCFETVEHFSRPGELIRELGRVTRPGGGLILTTPNLLWEPIHAGAAILGLHHSEGPHRFLRLGLLARLIQQAGFEIRRLETTVLIPAGPMWLVKIGEWIERRTRATLMPLFGLRRVIFAVRR